jgi:hypothetical protein
MHCCWQSPPLQLIAQFMSAPGFPKQRPAEAPSGQV